ncbi:MAG TPA: P1 family peptidase [Anaerolineales bacterium]|nr:P1 family peptidase [Anaerolineales bacterium]
MAQFLNSITDVPGIKVGHAHDAEAVTGCTVILCDGPSGAGAVGGVDQRGGAPGTRETDPLHPMHLVQKAHAIVLSGGSAFGLDAASGVVKWLEERGVGFDARVARVPIVPAAILFDLGIGRADVRPDAAMGYRACQNASADRPAEGNAGAGMGCTVGKILGPGQGIKSGIGTASVDLGRGAVVGAIMAVNAFGDVLENGKIIAGARSKRAEQARAGEPDYFADTLAVMKSLAGQQALGFARRADHPEGGQDTVIGVVATNANLTKEEVNKVAQMAHDGLARVIRPAHTMLDGDTLFALATGEMSVDVNIVGAYAAEVTAQAILNGVRAAESLAGWPSIKSLSTN